MKKFKILFVFLFSIFFCISLANHTLAANRVVCVDAGLTCTYNGRTYGTTRCTTYYDYCCSLSQPYSNCPTSDDMMVCCTGTPMTSISYCNGDGKAFAGADGCIPTGSTCYPNGSHQSCCSQISCSCTPSCPAGASSTYSGPLCAAGNASCSQSNECSSCTNTGGACYYPETNTSFIQSNGSTSGPVSVSMIVDSKTYTLSTDPNNPTHIKLPALGSSNVQITTPTFTAPVTSRGANYYFQANNYGNDNEWKTWTSCNADEDFCTIMPNANNTQTFDPTTLTVNQVLKEGATGMISAKYATTDKCADTYKYSLAIEGYYVVDYIPDPPDPCTPGDPTCTWIPEIGTNTTTRGCSSLTYTGTEINNELHINAGVTDTDSLDEIQAFTLWFSKDTNVPTVGTISASYSESVNTDLGIMIKKNGSDWNNPNIYTTNSDLTWGLISLTDGVGYINVAATNIIEISDISVTQDTNVIFDYKIRFINNDSNLSGMYNIYGGSLDTFMINGNLLDQSYFYKFFNWGIDLVSPTVEEITQQIVDPQNTYMTWSNADVTSGIGRTVINAYRLGGVSTDPQGIKLFLPSAYTTLLGAINLDPNAQIPSDSEIGLYNDTNAWKFNNNTGETDLVNVGDNESGKIALYITAYDKACNTNGTTDEIDLNPWFATRGATVYSQGNISSTAKDVAGLPYLDDVFNTKTGMNSDRIDLGTELLSTRNTSISNLLHINNGAVLATNIEDSNNTKGLWYTKLFNKLGKYRAELTSFVKASGDTKVSDSCDGTECYMYSTEDISIPSGYVCDEKTLFITEKDIHINPDVNSNGSSLSGCIFVAKNNIYVDAGTFKSTGSKVLYDYIEGYLIADNQIVFTVADGSHLLRDGVEIFGGAVAFGTTGGEGMSIQRNLRLYSQINPTVVITYDNKYSSISTIFFGTEYNLYKQEIGFKTF